MQPLVRVVSLSSEKERRATIKRQLNEKGFEFSFFDAVDLRRSTEESVRTFFRKDEISTLTREMTRGEVGCALSHMKLYLEISNCNSPVALVLEDDADISRVNKENLSYITSMIENDQADIVILGYSKLSIKDEPFFYQCEPIRIVNSYLSYTIGKPWANWTCGTVGYLISRKAACRIVSDFKSADSALQVSSVADDWSFFEKKYGLNIFHVRPLQVFEDFNGFDSSIEPDRREVSGSRIRYLNFLRLLRGQFRRVAWWIGFR
ncbi:glycosyltransferase family 25 protein [Halomonas sp. SCS19]|uniref:glycosyltransferase family 25 protein n=1 Tax=Halomonas sp. SCS19 TaxID=2950870 RepID=UPI0032DEFF4A